MKSATALMCHAAPSAGLGSPAAPAVQGSAASVVKGSAAGTNCDAGQSCAGSATFGAVTRRHSARDRRTRRTRCSAAGEGMIVGAGPVAKMGSDRTYDRPFVHWAVGCDRDVAGGIGVSRRNVRRHILAVHLRNLIRRGAVAGAPVSRYDRPFVHWAVGCDRDVAGGIGVSRRNVRRHILAVHLRNLIRRGAVAGAPVSREVARRIDDIKAPQNRKAQVAPGANKLGTHVSASPPSWDGFSFTNEMIDVAVRAAAKP